MVIIIMMMMIMVMIMIMIMIMMLQFIELPFPNGSMALYKKFKNLLKQIT